MFSWKIENIFLPKLKFGKIIFSLKKLKNIFKNMAICRRLDSEFYAQIQKPQHWFLGLGVQDQVSGGQAQVLRGRAYDPGTWARTPYAIKVGPKSQVAIPNASAPEPRSIKVMLESPMLELRIRDNNGHPWVLNARARVIGHALVSTIDQ